MRDIKLYIFDMDGTILDSTGFHTAYLRYMLDNAGIHMQEREIKPYMGITLKYIVDKLVPPHMHEQTYAQAEYFMRELADDYLHRCKPIPGAMEACAAARKTGAPVLLVTNSPDFLVAKLVSGFGLDAFFDGIHPAANNDLSKRERCERLMRKHGVPPGQTLLIGDSSNDASLAQQLHMRCALIRNQYSWINFEAGYDGGPVPCDVELDDISKLFEPAARSGN